jgi:hypothetical protein
VFGLASDLLGLLIRRLCVVAALCLPLASPASAAAPPTMSIQGQLGAYPWQLSFSAKPLGPRRLPGMCISFLWAFAPGETPSQGFPQCVATVTGRVTPHGVHWIFNLHSGGYQGVYLDGSAGGAGTTGVRCFAFLLDPRTVRVTISLVDHEVLRARSHALPARFHRAARVAWIIDSVRLGDPTALEPRTVTAYDRLGQVVGRENAA